MAYPGLCIDRDIVLPLNDKLKEIPNKKYHQFYLNPICGDVNDHLDSCHIEKYNADNMRLYKVVQYASELNEQYRFVSEEDVQIFVYWLHFLDPNSVLVKNKYKPKLNTWDDGVSYISRLPMVVEYSDALVAAFELGKYSDLKIKSQVTPRRTYVKELENYKNPEEIRLLNPKIRSLA